MTEKPVQYYAGAFPPADLERKRLIPLLGPTAAAVARYDGVLAAVPNPAVLLSPLTTEEAVLSSRIEGWRATFDRVGWNEVCGSNIRESDLQSRLSHIREPQSSRAFCNNRI